MQRELNLYVVTYLTDKKTKLANAVLITAESKEDVYRLSDKYFGTSKKIKSVLKVHDEDWADEE